MSPVNASTVVTAGLAVGGRIATTTTGVAEEYNGSSWTAVTAMPQACRSGGGTGPQTSALIFGGQISPPTAINSTFSYDGSSWTAQANLAIATNLNSGAGADSTSALSLGGYSAPTTLSASTEEYSIGVLEVQTVTTS